jgi:prepilin-type N-terminal cleavage/methylation domain-containing protein
MQPSIRPNSNIRPRYGFTLVEIIVVVLILAIAAAIIVPQAVQSSDVQSLAGARTLACDIEYARDLAITRATPITVKFEVANNLYRLRNASTDLVNPITQKAYVMSYATQAGLTKVTLVSTTFTGGMVTFDETGSPDAAGSATLRAGSWSYRIDVAAATGKVSVTAL